MESSEVKPFKSEIKRVHNETKEKLKKEIKEMSPNDRFNYCNQAICKFAALGFSPREISIQLEVKVDRVNKVIRSETGSTIIEKLQREMFFDNPQKMFMSEVPKAFRRVKKIIEDENAKHSEALNAANTIFDRALGKPIQEIKTEDSAVKKLIELIDRERNPIIETSKNNDVPMADFTEVKKEEKTEKDDIDQWLDDNLK